MTICCSVPKGVPKGANWFPRFAELFCKGETWHGCYMEYHRGWLEGLRKYGRPENVLILVYEKMKKDPKGELVRIANFLGGKAAELVKDERVMKVLEESHSEQFNDPAPVFRSNHVYHLSNLLTSTHQGRRDDPAKDQCDFDEGIRQQICARHVQEDEYARRKSGRHEIRSKRSGMCCHSFLHSVSIRQRLCEPDSRTSRQSWESYALNNFAHNAISGWRSRKSLHPGDLQNVRRIHQFRSAKPRDHGDVQHLRTHADRVHLI